MAGQVTGDCRTELTMEATFVERKPVHERQLGRSNLDAAAVALTPDHLRDIEASAAKITVQGARLPEDVL